MVVRLFAIMIPSLCLRKINVYLFGNLLFSKLSLSLISLCAFQCSGDHRFFLPVITVSPVHWNAAIVLAFLFPMLGYPVTACRHPSGSDACARDARSSRIGAPSSDARLSSNVVIITVRVK